MNKSELVKEVAIATNKTQVETAVVIDAIISSITKALKEGQKIQLTGFISLDVVQSAARTARNPQTGAIVDVPAKKKIKFKAGSQLTDAINL